MAHVSLETTAAFPDSTVTLPVETSVAVTAITLGSAPG
jgi:hypothetical protein